MATARAPENRMETENRTEDHARLLLRRQLLAQREALTQEDVRARSSALIAALKAHFPDLAARRVGFFWPFRNEPDLRQLMQCWQKESRPGFAALLPVVWGREAPLTFRTWLPGCAMQEDRFGISTPCDGPFVAPEALLIPAGGFDTKGFRIGYGGGFYDRTLAALNPRPLSIGIGFELGRVDSIRPQPHDVRLDAIVTEAGVHRSDP